MMVVAIVTVLAAMSYSVMIAVRLHADEASAVQSLRAIEAAEYDYAARHPSIGFTVLDNLPISDSSLKTGYKQDYEFTIVLAPGIPGQPNTQFRVAAMPAGLNELLASRSYYADETGTITFARGREPSADSLKVKINKAQ